MAKALLSLGERDTAFKFGSLSFLGHYAELKEILADNEPLLSHKADMQELNRVLSCKNYVLYDSVHPDIELRLVSKKIGRGVFAKADLPFGTVIMICKHEIFVEQN